MVVFGVFWGFYRASTSDIYHLKKPSGCGSKWPVFKAEVSRSWEQNILEK